MPTQLVYISLFKIWFIDFSWVDALDIVLVGMLLYECYKLIRGSVASRIFLGGLIIYLVYLVVRALHMELLTSILEQFTKVGVIAALILFQVEIRKCLLMLGKGHVFRNDFFKKRWFGRGEQVPDEHISIQPVIDAAKAMTQQHTGALIVFARSSELKFYAETGDEIDAMLSKRLLMAIFNKTSPMHDGATIVADGRILAARCILPITENQELPSQLGLRHRAAIGLTEITDALVLIVSEETGQISLAFNGRVERNLSPTELRARLNFYLVDNETTRIRTVEADKVSSGAA